MNQATFPTTRLRRLRQHPRLRDLVRETQIDVNDFVFPLFIHETNTENKPINSMPGHSQLALKNLKHEINEIVDLNIPAVMLFGIPNAKDPHGSRSFAADGIIQRAISEIKEIAPNLLVIVDSCFCEYTDHGHCGVVKKQKNNFQIDNDETLELLVKQALSYAKAGVDMLAPSGMMDGIVKALRAGLDVEGYSNISIMCHATKFSSSFYGPFREAAEGAPQFGNRASYQMDPANGKEALREVMLDVNEGADIVMVKPAMSYLDIIYQTKQHFPEIPVAAYQVSGEYAMIKAAGERGWINSQQVMMECLTGIKRAGASIIVSYFAKEVARLLQD